MIDKNWLKAFKPPFRKDECGGYWIWDSENTRVLDCRGWGFLTGTGAMNLGDDEATAIQDGFLEWVVITLNKSWEDS